MNVLLNPTESFASENLDTAPARASQRSPAQTGAPKSAGVPGAEPEAKLESAAPPSAGFLNANVTFRRDNSGQVYYVITDAKTGEELREIPPEAVRKVGEGIADYLKREGSKTSRSIEVKA